MTRERTRELLPVMQALLPVMKAFSEGKEIQYRDKLSGVWKDSIAPQWDGWYEYRVKPEKKSGWINIRPYGSAGAYIYPTREEADRYALTDRIACIPISFYEGEGL